MNTHDTPAYDPSAKQKSQAGVSWVFMGAQGR